MKRPPPEATRFKKGQSGNPKGRPRKAVPVASESGGIVDRFGEIVLAEAMRPITVREGPKTETIPAVQAILRSMVADAARGNSKIQREVLEMIRNAESARADAAFVILERAFEYKAEWGPKFAEAERDGEPLPDVHPHPADIQISEDGAVTFGGPITAERAGALQLVEIRALRLLPEYLETKRLLEADPSNRDLRRRFKELEKLHQVLVAGKDRMATRLAHAQSLLGQVFVRDRIEDESDAT